MSSTEQFWIENPFSLIQSFNIIPHEDDTLEERLNALTRVVIICWVILRIMKYDYRNSCYILFLSLLFIIILYYIQINNMREPFNLPLNDWRYMAKPDDLKIQTPSQFRFCKDQRPLGTNQDFFSTNQALANQLLPPGNNLNRIPNALSNVVVQNDMAGNPKTRMQPIKVAPIYDNTYWSEDFIVPMGINDQTNQELFQSGYLGTSKCGQTYGLSLTPSKTQGPPQSTQIGPQQHSIIEPFAFDQKPFGDVKAKPGDVLGCSYNPNLLAHNLPTNSTNGACQLNNVYNNYNKNLYTQIIEPGIYAQQQTIEPIQSNMGISWTQQFEPVRCEMDANGNRTFVSQDPRLAKPVEQIPRPPRAENSNIYDPRYNGYGTEYRQYIDPMTGQPRFYYDDVDAIRRPNYIVRSNIDIFPWADSASIMSNDTHASEQFSHALAQNQFLNDSLGFKTELQERYMRKYNNEIGWQKRQAPIHTVTAGGLRRR